MDGLRGTVNVLSEAFAVRSGQAMVSAGAHKLALGVMALERALHGGGAFGRDLRLLQQVGWIRV